jgi:hypothetical protein
MRADKQEKREHVAGQPESGPYTEQQLNNFPAIVYAYMDPTHAQCAQPLLAIATLRRMYLCSVLGVNTAEYTKEKFNRHNNTIVYSYYKQYLHNSQELLKACISNNTMSRFWCSQPRCLDE